MVLTYFSLALMACLCFAVLWALWKIRDIHLRIIGLNGDIARMMFNEYKQIEALVNLRGILEIQNALPGTRGWAGSPDFLLRLAEHAIKNRPLLVVECSSGSSTIVLARAAQLNGIGRVVSLESDPKFAELTRSELSRLGLDRYAEVLDAPLEIMDTKVGRLNWYRLADLPLQPIDMLVIDGPPANANSSARYAAAPTMFEKMARGGSIFLDDAGREGEQEVVKRWKEEFPEFSFELTACEKGLAVIRCPN